MQKGLYSKFPGKINSELSKLIGERWRCLPEKSKQIFNDLAIKDKDRYRVEMEKFNNIDQEEKNLDDKNESDDNNESNEDGN